MTEYRSRVESVALQTQDMIVHGIAAFVARELHFTFLARDTERGEASLSKFGEWHSVAYLASITIEMVVAIESNDSKRFVLAVRRKDSAMASVAAWRELVMETIDTVHFHLRIDGKRHTVETLAADHAAETLGMVRFTSGTKDLAGQAVVRVTEVEVTHSIGDRSRAGDALLQGVLEHRWPSIRSLRKNVLTM